MSISKIENKIELLEIELKEIDTTITDSIERNEYKIELQKQIKKLKRTKSQIEQQGKEKQELESLKLEFISSSDEAVRIQGSKPDCNQQIKTVKEAGKLTSAISSRSLSADPTFERQNKSEIPWIKIQLFIILGLVLTTLVSIAFIFSLNSVRKAEQVRLQELIKQEAAKAQEEIQKNRQEIAKAEQEKQEARNEAEKARQEVIQAKKKVDDLIKNNLYAEANTKTSPTEFIKKYYLNINNRNYNLTWQQFTPKRRANPQSFNSYIAWWNSVENTEIKQIKVLKQNNNQAVVYVELDYFMKTGTIYKERKSKIYLTWNSKYNNWLIEDHQQL